MHKYFILKDNLNNLIPILLVLIVGIFTHWQWFFIDGIFSSGDTLWSSRERILSLLKSPNLMSGDGLGSINISLSVFPANYLAGWLLNAGINQNLVYKIMFLFPIALITPLSFYLLTNYVLKNKISAITASSIYSYANAILVGTTGTMTSSVVLAIAPLIILFYIKLINEKNIYYLYLCLFYIFISISFDVRFVYLIYWILLIYTFYFYIIKYKANNKFQDIFHKNDIKHLLIFSLFSILINFYWILILFVDSTAIAQVGARSLWGSNLVNLTQSIFLNHSIWNNSLLIPFYHNPLRFSSLLAPFIFIAVLLVFNKKNHLLIFFIIIAFIGIFLTKMNHPPFIHIYEWLYLNMPGFDFFRESSKFYFFIAMGYAIAISSIFLTMKSRLLKYGLFIIINLMYLSNTIPLITSEINTMYVERKMPNDYKILNKMINNDKDLFFRSLYMPRYSQWGQDTPMHPRLDFMSQYHTNPTIKNILSIPGSYESKISDSKFIDYLNNVSVRYIILPIKDIENNDNFYEYLGEKIYWENLLKKLAKAKDFKKIDLNFKELNVYENLNYKGKFRLNEKTINEYDCIQFNNCEFFLDLNNKLSNITFSENFSSNYQIYIEKEGKDITKNYLIKHFKDDQGLNSFNVTKKDDFNGPKAERVLIKLKIKKELLRIQLIFGVISLISAIFIFYKIIFTRKTSYLT
jgi:hypothetical protein